MPGLSLESGRQLFFYYTEIEKNSKEMETDGRVVMVDSNDATL